ncbi:DUF349 domain-containing protein [Canibacter sp. lx-72]|uniref:DUF349 domain-containing protein n=1 Tax=Canibacter zhuwentaonis TaxID=2837491 RepID=UPI001BDD5F93|nr:DUF349 domain-containing protein [Canibacter zhuwentaonis]MBT1017883.1 DUF349 domain-containing protein [Canibacter zhuwentaonis]MBT1035046.1 DUF349 domain-containing protein [Canibacter zhuwentaonis]
MTETNQGRWGRVDADGTVYVKDNGEEREVGQFSDGTPEEALALYERRYADLQGEVTLLEARIAKGTADAQVAKTVEKLAGKLVAPHAVGDLEALRKRVHALSEKAQEFATKQREKREQERAVAFQEREAIVVAAEQIAQRVNNGEKLQWNDTSKIMQGLFEKWQTHQSTSAHLPKSQADQLWKRFRDARKVFDKAKSEYFAKTEAKFKLAREAKENLVKQAAALAGSGGDGVKKYRVLLDEWKKVGSAGRKYEDKLWAKFKAAGDIVYNALKEEMAVTDEEFKQNLVCKEELLAEAETLLSESNHKKARKALSEYQMKWDEIGRVPRDQVREVEARMRKIEAHVKKLEDDYWQATDPEPAARTEGLSKQLSESIAQLEAELVNAPTNKKAALEEKLKTQREWLAAITR